MGDNRIKKIVIVGGGTAGWMTAALLTKMMGKKLDITLVESDTIGTIGVGEATIPPIQLFNIALGLKEDELLKQTQGTIKLGIEFENWGKIGDSYMHAFGPIGREVGMVPFQHYWSLAKQAGDTSSLWDYSFNYQAAKANRFQPMSTIAGTPLAGITHAYHFDAILYAQYLRRMSEYLGTTRIEGLITDVNLRSEDGFIESVTLQSGETISGDLFIDCSGIRALLIEGALKTGYEDYNRWLLCNRAVAVPCSSVKPTTPYTKSTAHTAGWQWRIPLQHRTGNGHVYCSDFISDDEAVATLMDNLDGEVMADPFHIKYNTGRRKKFWNKNCIAIGLSSGFLEPLESTSIHLIQSGVIKLIQMFPSVNYEQTVIDEYNKQTTFEFERIRDFIILHYHANQRTDTPFWTHCREMDIPDTLRQKMDFFKETGRVVREGSELFTEDAWLQVMVGQNILPEDYHPLAEQLTSEQMREYLANLKTIINGAVTKMPSHDDYVAKHYKAEPM